MEDLFWCFKQLAGSERHEACCLFCSRSQFVLCRLRSTYAQIYVDIHVTLRSIGLLGLKDPTIAAQDVQYIDSSGA